MKKFNTHRLRTALLAVALASGGAMFGAELTVNSGEATESHVPFHFYYLDNAACRSQVIFPAEQLSDMVGSSIRELKFYLNSSGFSGNWSANNMIVTLGETELSAFDAPEGYASFIDTSDFSVAFSGEKSGAAGDTELSFELSAPYLYNGGDLFLQISLGENGNAYPSAYFLGVNTDDYQSAWTASGSTIYGAKFLPQTSFTYGEVAQYEAAVSVSEIQFPTTMIGQSSTSSVTVRNTGAESLGISLQLAEGAFAADCSAATIDSGSSLTIPVTFTPTEAGTATAQMTLDLGEAGTFTVDLSGNGMTAPTGYVTNFNLEDKTLPENWIGWHVMDTYSYDTYDWVAAGAQEGYDYFLSNSKNDVAGIGITESNPVRDYPNRYSVYMISPAVSGNVMMQLASNASTTWVTPEVKVYNATEGADGNWVIDSTPLNFSWASEPGDGWGTLIGTVDGPSNLAIFLSYMTISNFAADSAEGVVDNSYLTTVSAESLDFGSVVTGKSASLQLSVTNAGTKAFDISANNIENEAFSVEASANHLEPLEVATFDVTFTPSGAGEYNSELIINWGESNVITIPITAQSVAAVVGSEFTVDNITYKVLSATTAGVSGVASEVTECAIPATITNEDGIELNVTTICDEAFYYSNVAKVDLAEGITTIEAGAFRSSELEEISLPSSLSSIGNYAFRSTKLKSIVIPDGVSSISSSLFASCEQLTEITLPANITSIGSGAFYKSGISSIAIPASCTTIDMEAFELCSNLQSVQLPEGLTEIASMTFLGCSALKEIEIPANVTTIRTRAFEQTGLTTLNIPASVTTIASNSFTASPINTITVDEANESFKVVDGVLYSADGGFLYLSPVTALGDSYTVVDGTRGIIGGAFYANSAKEVTLPESVIGIDEYAFCLSNLETINLPEGIFTIGTQAFAGTKLTEVTLPASLEDLSDALFAGCTELSSVTLPATTANVGNRAFYGCSALSEIICEGETPAEFDAWEAMTAPFYGVECDNVTVYCPDGDDILAVYKDSEWADFFANIKNISERELSGINNILNGKISIIGGNNLTVNLGNETANIYVVSTAGVKLASVSNATGSVTLNDLPAGICLVKVATANGIKTTKAFIK